MDEEAWIVTFTQLRVDTIGNAFLGQRELGIEANSVAARVDAMPGIREMDGDQTVKQVPLAVSQALVAQASRDPFCPEDRHEEMGLGEAQSCSLVQHLGSGDRDS